jgi:hypothetical protein
MRGINEDEKANQKDQAQKAISAETRYGISFTREDSCTNSG